MDELYAVKQKLPSNDAFMNQRCNLQTFVMENNNNLQVPCTVAEIDEYIAKYISKDEPKDDILELLKKKMADNKK